MSNLFAELIQAGKTCRTCEHRQRWEKGGRIIQYCGVRESGRTSNGFLKITVKTPACLRYLEAQK